MQFQTQYSTPMAGQGTMPGRTPGMSAAGMDWSGEITPPPVPQGASVVAYDDPAAIRDASANGPDDAQRAAGTSVLVSERGAGTHGPAPWLACGCD